MAAAAPWQDVVEILGGKRVFGLGAGRATPERITEGVRAGLAPACVRALTEVLDLTPVEVGVLVEIPERTLARRLTQKRLEADESDRVFRVGRIVARAREVIGPPERAREWLKAP